MGDYDVKQIMAEIQAEVEGHRAAGTLPPNIERELDEIFADIAPTGVAAGDIEGQIVRLEEASHLDLNPPTESNVPGGSYIKRAERRVLAWYMVYVAEQFADLGAATIRAVRSLAARLDHLETALLKPEEAADYRPRLAAPVPDMSGFIPRLVAALGHVPGGRVLHAECADTSLLVALAEAGIDSYGVGVDEGLVLGAAQADLDVRQDTALDHMAKLGDGVLGAVVLSGSVDTEDVAAKSRLVELAIDKTRPGGVVAIVSSDPESWRSLDDIAVDLAPGSPLRPAAWIHLLELEDPSLEVEIVREPVANLVLAAKPKT